MPIRFFVARASRDLLNELSASAPTNPFATPEYVESRLQLGCDAWVMGVRDSAGKFRGGCGAFLRSGRLNRALTIPSLPKVDPDSPFWSGLRDFAKKFAVTQLELGTFSSPAGVAIPRVVPHCRHSTRTEYLWDLTDDPASRLASNHKRNLKKGRAAGLSVRQSRSDHAAHTHLALMNRSMERRRSRGEDVPDVGDLPDLKACLDSGAGTLFQALLGSSVLASVCVLRAPKGGYYQSAGTSPEGMSVGASHFLLHAIAQQLKIEGAETFNLGGADENSGLARFKEGFGSSIVQLEQAECYVGPVWRRMASAAYEVGASGRARALRFLHSRVSRLVVYAAETEKVSPPPQHDGLEFRKLSREDLLSLQVQDDAFRARQVQRLNRFGDSYAYAVFADGRLAHVSWLLPSVAMKRDLPQVLIPRNREAEITACETLPSFRGRGLYGFAIRSLLDVARREGIVRVFMKTTVENKESQSGIQKAGLPRIGSAVLLGLPFAPRPVVWRRFR